MNVALHHNHTNQEVAVMVNGPINPSLAHKISPIPVWFKLQLNGPSTNVVLVSNSVPFLYQ